MIAGLLTCGGGGGGRGTGNPAPTTTACTSNNPADPDTDGDGLDDFDEVVTKAFDSSNNNFKFNPRIADVPEIRVQLDSIPDFEVTFTDSQSTSQTRSMTTGNRTTTTLTNSFTYEQSVGEELSSSLGSTGGSSGFDVSSSTTYSQNQQETMSRTNTQSRENSRFRETAESETSEQGVQNTGGKLSVLVTVENLGDQVITLNNLTLTARQVDPNDPTAQALVGGMDYDTSQGAFPSFDIPGNTGNNKSAPLPFVADLTLGKIYALLEESRNLTIQPTTWQIVDVEGRSYTHALTNVNARAAQVIIDYDGVNNRAIENHYVATVTDFQQNRISAASAMNDILQRSYTEGNSSASFNSANSGLLSILNVANDDSINGRWIVIHNYLDSDSVTRLGKTYDINRGSYSLDDIELAAGEVLHFMYFQDQDGDGLGSREEFMHGTLDDDLDRDSDNDGLTGFEEIKEGWEIPVTRTLTRRVSTAAPSTTSASSSGRWMRQRSRYCMRRNSPSASHCQEVMNPATSSARCSPAHAAWEKPHCMGLGGKANTPGAVAYLVRISLPWRVICRR